MNVIKHLAVSALLFITLFNGTLVKKASLTGNSLPDVNFSGTITDVDNKSYDVQNLTISGIYKNIIVYPKPNDPKNFSTRNFEKLDLAEIKEIRPDRTNTFEHRGKKYIGLQVIRKDGGVDEYVVMGRKSVQATREPKSGSIAKIIDMNQLKSLSITGYTKREEDKEEDNNNKETTNKETKEKENASSSNQRKLRS